MTEESKMILEQLEKVDDKIADIQLTLENVTNRNIKLIAEGHLDLSGKPDETLKAENEKEMLLFRVNSLENEVRRLRAKIEAVFQKCVYICNTTNVVF